MAHHNVHIYTHKHTMNHTSGEKWRLTTWRVAIAARRRSNMYENTVLQRKKGFLSPWSKDPTEPPTYTHTVFLLFHLIRPTRIIGGFALKDNTQCIQDYSVPSLPCVRVKSPQPLPITFPIQLLIATPREMPPPFPFSAKLQFRLSG